MPWFFTIPEFLKKRACRYLLQHYLGQFLEEKICLDDLTVDLYNGTGSIHNVPLNVEAINEVLLETGAPVKVISGYLGCVTVSVPWTALLKDNCKVEISELALCVAPNVLLTGGDDPGTMTDSLFFSMTSSMQMAEEVLKSGPSPGEGEAGNSPGFEGMEALARAIELVLARVQISLTDATVQVNYRTPDQTQEYFLKVRINSIEFYDELSKLETSVDTEGSDSEGPPAQPTPDFAVKVLQLSGLTVEVGSTQLSSAGMEQSVDDSLFNHPDSMETSVLNPKLFGVPIATAGGQLSVKVKIKQNENEPGPKLEIDAFLGSLHLLISPQQMSMLLDMATGIASQGATSSSSFEKLHPGQSRPIPKSDMKTIESQLVKHQLKEQKVKAKLQKREDLFHADPWDNSLGSHNPPHNLTESTYSSVDDFYSLDLNASYAASTSGTSMTQSMNMEDSFVSTTSKASSQFSSRRDIHSRCMSNDVEDIPLHSGAGLQQLAQDSLPSQRYHSNKGQSPSTRRRRAESGASDANSRKDLPDVCKYNITFGGITLALLETEPMYMYTTPGITSHLVSTSQAGHSPPLSGPNLTETNRYSSVDEGGLDPLKYFETVSELLKDGVNRKELENNQEEMAQVLPNDHLLLWLSTVKCSIVNIGAQVDLDLSVASAELWEYLYRNQAKLNHITKPVSVSPIVQLFEDSSVSPAMPCFKVKLSTSLQAESTKKKSRDNCPEQHTSLDISMATVHLNADVTLLDRLQPLLNALSRTNHTSLRTTSLEKVKQSLYMTTSNIQTINTQRQAVFNHAVASDSPPHRDHRLTLKAKCTTFNVSLRFPIPDLKDTKRPPWYLPSLRSEVLFISVNNVGVSSLLHPSALAGEGAFNIDLKFDSTKAYLSCDGSVQNRELFLTVSSNQTSTSSHTHQTTSGFTECGRLRLVVQPMSDSALERGGSKGGLDVRGYERCGSLEGLGSEVKEPQPFSSKKSMFSTGRMMDKDLDGPNDHTEVHSEELVLPGSPKEMADFEQHASSSAQYAFTCTLPEVKVHLPSNKFLGILYNRFATDLALWEPASPTAVEKANAKSMMYSCMDVLQPAATKEDRFEMCKSVLKEEDSDDESTVDGRTDLFTQNLPGFDHTHRKSESSCGGMSFLSFSLTVENGTVSMLSEADKTASNGPESDHSVDSSLFHSAQSVAQLLDLSPKQTSPPENLLECGLILMRFSDLHLFTVLGYRGDITHDYFCAQIGEFSLDHVGSLNQETYSCVDDQLGNHSVLSTLLPVVYKSASTEANKPHLLPGSHDLREPMLAVAMEMRLDKERNSKTNKCSVALHNTTVQYHMTTPEHSCFKQLGDFFNLVDDVVPGYEAPSIITELHTHLNSCSVEYKPLHLPLHMLLLLDSVSLSTSVVTGAPVLVVRLVTDGTYLLLAHEQHEHPDPRQGFVCVLEMEWFELTLRLCNNAQLGEEYQKLFSRMPDISIECSSNAVHLRTCVDTCIALRDLIVYLATNGDLQDAPTGAGEERILRDYSRLGNERDFSSLSSQNSCPGSNSPLTSLTDTTDIGDLINEAMEDLPNPDSPQTHSERNRSGTSSGRKLRHTKSTGQGKSKSKATMAVHVANDKSVVLDFCSDSSEEDDDRDVKSVRSEGGVRSSRDRFLSPPLTSGKLSGSDQGSIFSESDDDFCFVDTPTSTKVAPGNKPQVKCLLEGGEKVNFIENHFSLPDGHTDQLQRPKHFPEPTSQFTLKEMTIIWHLYGGSDFRPPSHSPSPNTSPALNAKQQTSSSPTHRLGGIHSTQRSIPVTREHPLPRRARSGSGNGLYGNKKLSQGASPAFQRKYSSSPGSDFVKIPAGGTSRGGGTDWKSAGGPGRQHDVLVEIELDKLRFQHETFPCDTEQSSRLVLLINDLEIRDKLKQSNINKLLYQYTTETMPRQSHANMLSLKVLFTRPELDTDPSIEEASIRLSILPIRLNIDQDTILFLYDFIKQVGDTTAVVVSASPDLTVGNGSFPVGPDAERRGSGAGVTESESPPLNYNQRREVFIRSFIFQPDLPIRIDYEAKGFKTEMGTLAGILLGLGHLNTSEVRLKGLTYKKGLLGWDKLLEYASNEWAQDIKGYQLPLILKGVGPMHHVTQLVYGMVDLVWLPYQQYQEDGRIIWGLQRGATAFTSSTGVAIVELSSRLLESVQSFAQMAYDMVAPNECPSQALVHQHKPHEPLDFREGFANAYDVVSAGIGGTARDMYSAAAKEHDERGVSGAVGGVLRQIPGTIVKPIILASEATRHVLGGVKNQFVPDARKEANKKWKTADITEQH